MTQNALWAVDVPSSPVHNKRSKGNQSMSKSNVAHKATEHAPPVPQSAPVAVASPYKYKLESDVPLPEKRTGPRGESAYPFKVMEVGQSFFVPATEDIPEPWKTITSTASRITRDNHPKQFTTARQTVDGQEGVRVWRKPDTDKPLLPPKKINRKAKGEAARLAAEAVEGDTSNPSHPEPDFEA